jgi:hypothetical protein
LFFHIGSKIYDPHPKILGQSPKPALPLGLGKTSGSIYVQFSPGIGRSPPKIEWFVGFFWLKECDRLQKQVFLNGF